MISTFEIIMRLIVSAIIGGLIGMEREANNRPAGLRTHILVTIGSALIMLISIYGFDNLGRSGDPARLAAQVVNGIGFLGAGTIMRNGNDIKGLTTAATIWVCGGIGLAIGGGHYVGGLATAGIVLYCLIGLGAFEKQLFKKKYKVLILECIERAGLIGDVGQVFGSNNITVKDIKISRNTDEDNCDSDKSQESIEEEKAIKIQFMLKICGQFSRKDFYNEIKKVKGVQQVIWND